MSWEPDFTNVYKSDIVGLESDVADELTARYLEWAELGPPRTDGRNAGGVFLYQETIAESYLLAYVIDDVRQRYAVLWLRQKPAAYRR